MKLTQFCRPQHKIVSLLNSLLVLPSIFCIFFRNLRNPFHCKLNQRKDVYHVFAHYFQLTQNDFCDVSCSKLLTPCVCTALPHSYIRKWMGGKNCMQKFFAQVPVTEYFCYCCDISSKQASKKQHNLFSSIWIKIHLWWLHVAKSAIPLPDIKYVCHRRNRTWTFVEKIYDTHTHAHTHIRFILQSTL